jgi:hypothetical protein
MIPTIERMALQHIVLRKGQADRDELRRIWQPTQGDPVVDGLASRGLLAIDHAQRLTATVDGERALADAEWGWVA